MMGTDHEPCCRQCIHSTLACLDGLMFLEALWTHIFSLSIRFILLALLWEVTKGSWKLINPMDEISKRTGAWTAKVRMSAEG